MDQVQAHVAVVAVSGGSCAGKPTWESATSGEPAATVMINGFGAWGRETRWHSGSSGQGRPMHSLLPPSSECAMCAAALSRISDGRRAVLGGSFMPFSIAVGSSTPGHPDMSAIPREQRAIPEAFDH